MMPANSKYRQVAGTYRLTGRVAEFDRQGRPRLRLRLSCAQRDLVALLWIDRTSLPERISYLQPVAIQGFSSDYAESCVVLQSLHRANRQSLDALPPLHLIPRCYAAQPDYLDRLICDVRRLHPLVRETADRIFYQPLVAERFISIPASRNHHHSEPGGLLVHSLDTASRVRDFIERGEPCSSALYADLGYLAGLLHDIGKIRHYNRNGNLTAEAHLVQHDQLTLELCTPGLKWLESQQPDLASLLRHAWTAASPGARYGRQPLHILARYLRDADAHSAKLDSQSKSWRKLKPGQTGRVGQDRFWKPDSDQLGYHDWLAKD